MAINKVKLNSTEANILLDVINVNELTGTSTAYASKGAARSAITASSNFRKEGQILTYNLQDFGWYTEQFLGDPTVSAQWTSDTYWKAMAPIEISQNTETGHTDIKIGGDSYPVASIITDDFEINSYLKEFYIADSDTDLSNLSKFRFYFGSSNLWGVELRDSSNNLIVRVAISSQTKPSSLIIASDGGAVIDFDSLMKTYPSITYYEKPITFVSEDTKDINFWPTIKSSISESELQNDINGLGQQISQLSPTLNSVVKVSDSAVLNDCIKELYLNIPDIDLSQYTIARLYYGNSNLYGVSLYKDGHADEIRLAQTSSVVDLTSAILTDGTTYYVLIDWGKVNAYCGDNHYKNLDVVISSYVEDVNYWPSIYGYITKHTADKQPMFGSDRLLQSGGIYNDLFGSVSADFYSNNQVTNNSSAGNLTFGADNHGKLTATVSVTGDTKNFYFGFSGSNITFKANHKYKLVALFKNEGFVASALKGIIRKKRNGESAQNTSFAAVFTGNYVRLEYVVQENVDFTVPWFCIYQSLSQSNTEGAKLTYLDLCIIESPVVDDNTLNGLMYERIKTISRNEIQDAINGNYNHIINVYPNNTPCQIANLIRSITDASEDNKYLIKVHNGEYQETDIITKDYVDIEGEDYFGTILIHNSNATYNSPNNYSLGEQYSNIPVNTIPTNYKHLIYHMSSSKVSNLTLKTITTDSEKSCKYICHQDSDSSKFTAVFEHCYFYNQSGTQIIGIGAKGGQHFIYTDCLFFDDRNRNFAYYSSFNLHNKKNGTEPSGVCVEKCNFLHCGRISVTDLGSDQTDYFEFFNNTCDNPSNTFIHFFGTNDTVAYSIILRNVGGNLGGIVPDNTRPDSGISIQGDNISMIFNSNSIDFGTALTHSGGIASNANDGYVFKLSSLSGENAKTINTFTVGFGLAVADSYAQNDEVYINNGVFTKTPNGNVAGKVILDAELNSDGYIMIRK